MSHRDPNHRRSNHSGFTLLETLLSVVLLAGVASTAYVGVRFVTDQAARDQVIRSKYQDTQGSIGEIERAIRDSTEILKAGDGVLALMTRYYLDDDDGDEKVTFTLNADGEIVMDFENGAKSGSQVLLTGVTTFEAQSLKIWEDFDRVDYVDPDAGGGGGGGGLLGGLLGAAADSVESVVDSIVPVSNLDTKSKAEYKLSEIDELKAALLPFVDTDRQRIEAAATIGSQTLTVSPAVRKRGLRIDTTFSPLDTGVEYQPVVWGDEAVNDNQVAVIFAADQSIRLATHEGGSITSIETSGLTWSPTDTYRFRVKFDADLAIATVSVNGGAYQRIGSVDTGDLDQKAVRFRTISNNARASWDSVDIDYPFVELHVVINAGDREQHLWGGATKRGRDVE